MTEQKIKQDDYIRIGANIRAIRKIRKIKQTVLVARLQVMGISMTRETLVKIERGIQHIQATQLMGIRDVLETTYDDLLKSEYVSASNDLCKSLESLDSNSSKTI